MTVGKKRHCDERCDTNDLAKCIVDIVKAEHDCDLAGGGLKGRTAVTRRRAPLLGNARSPMVTMLDSFRGTLEDLGGGLGVTDPVSGPVVLALK